MELDATACYRALKTRDPRFDGRFFTGVVSTGIYCRPICPARTPKPDHCRFFACAAAAQNAGFRPCLRCRPESSPGSAPWVGTSATVRRALRLIAEGALDGQSTEDLAMRLGVGARHLRRLFVEHLGTTPGSVAQTRRIHFAKRLLDETSLTMVDVASAAGFSSIRRFNTAIRTTYGKTPSALRRASSAQEGRARQSEVRLRLPFRPPLQWEALLEFLARRATPGVEQVAAGTYRRTFELAGAQGALAIAHAGQDNHLEARIQISDPAALIQVVARLRRVFDLDADPEQISAHLSTDRHLAPLVRARPGLRLPGGWDGFEIAVRAILGQQVSVEAATTLAGRLVQAYGPLLQTGRSTTACDDLNRLFPGAAILAQADLSTLGMPRRRAAAVSALASAVHKREVLLDGSWDLERTLGALRGLPGLGDWTAQYIAMRALHEPDALPAGDLALRRALRRGQDPAKAPEVASIAEAWRPWRSYGVLYLWNMEADHAALAR